MSPRSLIEPKFQRFILQFFYILLLIFSYISSSSREIVFTGYHQNIKRIKASKHKNKHLLFLLSIIDAENLYNIDC
jgi:hypothetical protein